jgi:DNA-binding beta-propeller fold protein YncE
VVTPDGTQVWVDGGNAVCIYTLDIDSNTLGSFTSDDLAVPTSIAFSPDGDLAYVTDLQNKTVVEFDLTGVEQGVVNLSYGPTWCRVNASTGALYTDRPYEVLSFSVTKNGKYLYVPFAHSTTTETGNTVVMYNSRKSNREWTRIDANRRPRILGTRTVVSDGERCV